MSFSTDIQWCDSTTNPVMGCGGCELFPPPGVILTSIDQTLRGESPDWHKGRSRQMFGDLISAAWQRLEETEDGPGHGHVCAVTTYNIYHLRKEFQSAVASEFGRQAGKLALKVIESKTKCYAAKLHLNRAFAINKPTRRTHKGYAPSFEQVTEFDGRIAESAAWSDLYGTSRDDKPWLDSLPRLIFVSDMGDAFSKGVKFNYLRSQYQATQTRNGRRHLWLWLTKRPGQMKRFADSIGGFADNICAMTSVTSVKTLHRIDSLRQVDCQMRGLSIEPLSTPLPHDLDLTGIGWVIVGGESGAKANVAPFQVEWAEQLLRLCREQNVAYFLKQLGTRPMRSGELVLLKDHHGGDWTEWPTELQVREFPEAFHTYRQRGVE